MRAPAYLTFAVFHKENLLFQISVDSPGWHWQASQLWPDADTSENYKTPKVISWNQSTNYFVNFLNASLLLSIAWICALSALAIMSNIRKIKDKEQAGKCGRSPEKSWFLSVWNPKAWSYLSIRPHFKETNVPKWNKEIYFNIFVKRWKAFPIPKKTYFFILFNVSHQPECNSDK